jgi:site-specific DNA-methyltransferase (cytosine-N4-specific)
VLTILRDDCRRALRTLDTARFRVCVTSPPYYEQRDYLPADHPDKALEIGHEATPGAYVAALVGVFGEVRRTLTVDGTLWVNIGDKFATRWGSKRQGRRGLAGDNNRTRSRAVPEGFKEKDLMGLPWRFALAMQDAGWWLRADMIWSKPNAMPESVVDRPTVVHEYVFLFAASQDYFFDRDAIREQSYHPLGRNSRSVWEIATVPSDGKHVAPMPPALARRCILAGSKPDDEVLDPFGGSGMVGAVAEQEGRHATLIDLDERAVGEARANTAQAGLFALAPQLSGFRDPVVRLRTAPSAPADAPAPAWIDAGGQGPPHRAPSGDLGAGGGA